MFATLAGGLPFPPIGTSPDEPGRVDEPASTRSARAVAEAVALQVELGLEPVSDADLRHGDPVVATALGLDGVAMGPAGPMLVPGRLPAHSSPILVAGWQATAALTDRAVKQVVAGPYSLGRRLHGGGAERERVTVALAEALNAELRALASAGCPLIQVDEPEAVAIGDSPAEALLFRDAQRRLLEGVDGVHVCLAITGGNVDPAGPSTFFDAPYASFLFDLIDGPDNWRLIARAPSERGILCGVVPGGDQPTVEKEVVVWAAHYAASTMGRGLERVGLATSGSLAGRSWAVARQRVELLALSAAIAAEPSPRQMVRRLDPHAFKAAPRARRRR